jgi:UDP-GlcNAc:undecaprenyl-phosphate GlcNAc-1-phosphate transferase
LAAGLATVSLVGFSILSMAHQSAFSFAVSLATLGGVAGFLFFNWNPASVLMGDSGSHFLGFVLAALAIGFSADPFQNIGHFVGPIMIIGLPVFDTALAIWRRISKDRSPFLGDREHLYDKLMHHGFSVKETVMVCCVIHAIIVGIGIGIYL